MIESAIVCWLDGAGNSIALTGQAGILSSGSTASTRRWPQFGESDLSPLSRLLVTIALWLDEYEVGYPNLLACNHCRGFAKNQIFLNYY